MDFRQYLKEHEELLVENFLTELPSKVKKLWEKITLMLMDNVEVTSLLKKSVGRGKLTPEEMKYLKSVLIDNAKALGVGTLFLPPGGGLLLGVIYKLLKKQGIDILPSRISELTNKEKD